MNRGKEVFEVFGTFVWRHGFGALLAAIANRRCQIREDRPLSMIFSIRRWIERVSSRNPIYSDTPVR